MQSNHSVHKSCSDRCRLIIAASSALAATAAAVSFSTTADAVVIVPIQVGMVVAVAHEYGVSPSEAALRSTVYASLGQILGKGVAQIAIRAIPGVGNAIRAATAGTVTAGVGWTVVNRLESGEALV